MIAEISIIPIGKGVSLSKYVARAVKIIARSGLKYQVTSMGTIIEGNIDKVFAVIKQCHLAVLRDSSRVYTRIIIDDRKGKIDRMTYKVTSVIKKLSRYR